MVHQSHLAAGTWSNLEVTYVGLWVCVEFVVVDSVFACVDCVEFVGCEDCGVFVGCVACVAVVDWVGDPAAGVTAVVATFPIVFRVSKSE